MDIVPKRNSPVVKKMKKDQKYRGLDKEIRKSIIEIVMLASQIYDSLPASNLKKFVTSSNGSRNTKVEYYKGPLTTIEFRRQLERMPKILELGMEIKERQPELIGWVGNLSGGMAVSLDAFISNLAIEVANVPFELKIQRIDDLMTDLDYLLAKREIEFSQIAILELGVETYFEKKVALRPNIELRCLSRKEIEDFLSHDIMDNSILPTLSWAEMALESKFVSSLYLSDTYLLNENLADAEIYTEVIKRIYVARDFLHLFKNGVVKIQFQTIKPISHAFPFHITRILGNDPAAFFKPYVLNESEMIELEKLANRINRFYDSDETLRAVITFFSKSAIDHRNELTHLFSVLEVFKKRFACSQSQLAPILSLSKSKINRLAVLANNNLTQGRHAGENFETLRDATEEELNESREIARDLILSYISFCEGNTR